MKRAIIIALTALGLSGAIFGCHDTTPPPPRTPIPSANNPDARTQYEPPRPLEVRQQEHQIGGDVYASEPAVVQPPPEQRAFLDAYHHVGRPRLMLFVNRTPEGEIIHVPSNTASAPQQNEPRRSGELDEINAKALDYEAVENIMTDWLAAKGQTTIISPTLARQLLTEDQLKDIQSGRLAALSDVGQRLGADVLVQVQARPSRQLGYAVRMVSEAINTRGGQSIGRAVVDIPPPLDKYRVNEYTRFLARKLMNDMTSSWGAMAVADLKAPIVPNPVPPPIAPAPPDKPAPVPTPIPPPDKPAPPPKKPVPSPQPPTTQEHPLPPPQPPLPPVPPDVPPTTQPH